MDTPAGPRERGHGEKILTKFPRIQVRTRREMARLLREWRWLLDAVAHYHLGDRPEAQEAVNTVLSRMLAPDEQDLPHALRSVVKALHQECYRRLRDEARPRSLATESRARGIPYDDRVGAVVGEIAEAAAKLPPKEGQTFMLAARGLRVADIAVALRASPKTVRMRLYRARKSLRRQTGLLGVAFPAPWGAMGRRVRQALQRLTSALRVSTTDGTWLSLQAATVGPQLAWVTVAAVSVIASSFGTTSASPPSSAALASVVVSSAADLTARHSESGRHTTPTPSPREEAPLSRTTLSTLPILLHPAPTTPADTHLIAASPAPDYGRNHTVVALGEGNQCHCLLLFRSTDGGARWSTAPGPPDGNQIALPPTYPADPRVFIGNDALATGTVDYVAASFGGPYSPLPGAPGQVALSSAFDRGDPIAFISTAGGVVAVNMSPVPHVAGATLVTSGVWGLASVITAPTGEGVLVLAPPGSAQLSAAAVPSATSSLLACHVTGCTEIGTTGQPVAQRLLASVTYATDHVLAAYANTGVVVSTDGGLTFRPLALPAGVTSIRSLAVEDGRAWLGAADDGGSLGAYWLQVGGGGAWHRVPIPDDASRAFSDALVAVAAGRVLAILDGQGYRCTTDAARTWAAACPSA